MEGASKGVTVERCLPSVLFDVHDNCKSNASIIDERMKKKKTKERIKMNIGFV